MRRVVPCNRNRLDGIVLWEDEAKEAINTATGALKGIDDATSCDDASKLAGATSTWYALRAEKVRRLSPQRLTSFQGDSSPLPPFWP